MGDTLRIAMWSGPRNISTAMMRSWENRVDTCVVDEPLYAHYLKATGIDHPGRDEILKSQNNDWRQVTGQLVQQQPDPQSRIYYQKHMSHHQLETMDIDWLLPLVNCFLLRDPDAVVASYSVKRPNLTPQDLGYAQLLRIFEFVRTTQDIEPIVIDSDLFLQNPRRQLQMICNRLGIGFSERMLKWPAGKRDSDGVWAKYWYHNVESSQEFAPWTPKDLQLSRAQQEISDACRPYYVKLRKHCINTD